MALHTSLALACPGETWADRLPVHSTVWLAGQLMVGSGAVLAVQAAQNPCEQNCPDGHAAAAVHGVRWGPPPHP